VILDWSIALIAAPAVLLLGALLFRAGGWKFRLEHVLEHGHDASSSSRITSVEIVVERSSQWFHFFGSRIMFQGESVAFKVVCKNAKGIVVTPTDVTAVVNPPTLATDVVSADGTAGTLSAAVDQSGPGTLVATAGGVASAPFAFTVDVDNKVASVEVQLV
jgi:hypothetical protein